jgi:hypothetical protein
MAIIDAYQAAPRHREHQIGAKIRRRSSQRLLALFG